MKYNVSSVLLHSKMLSVCVTICNRDKYFFEKLAENIKNNEFPVTFLTAFHRYL